MLQRAMETGYINMNCVDPLGRSALLMAIDNENPEMVELLIEHRVETKDALLHAISEEFVEAVEVLLEHEEALAKPGQPTVSILCSTTRVTVVTQLALNIFLIFSDGFVLG
ncbi:hypothetical protein AAG570_002888 [Ranatra chinensis]|uniref:Uncharacterized protein n=1 Tax=Ranatra chinensis TaxID=642074 RepID=A0ABD0YRY3_9HEMI